MNAAALLPRRTELTHSLGPDLQHFASIASRRDLERDGRYRALRPELDRLLCGFEWELEPPEPAPAPRHLPHFVRALAWNVERGKRFEPLLRMLTEDEALSSADLYLFNEVDIGMGRSGNRNVPRELARALGLRYVFANSHLVLSPGDSAERAHGVHNELALHGNALLSRFPVLRFESVRLPEFNDKFHVLEKRLGDKRALLCDVLLSDGPLTVAVVHLDPFASSYHRAWQLRRVLRRLRARGSTRVLLGGDLNTTTYNLGTRFGLAANLAHKFTRFGFRGTIEQYMTPEAVFERPVFDVLRAGGFLIDGFNDRSRGTIYYDVNEPELAEKTVQYVPQAMWRWLQWRLEPWGGVVPLRLDWFAGRGLTPLAATVVERPRWKGERIADHNPILVDLKTEARGTRVSTA
jgi:endonuclease/exonuclease/phosphatase family metal-dependent hydrolase